MVAWIWRFWPTGWWTQVIASRVSKDQINQPPPNSLNGCSDRSLSGCLEISEPRANSGSASASFSDNGLRAGSLELNISDRILVPPSESKLGGNTKDAATRLDRAGDCDFPLDENALSHALSHPSAHHPQVHQILRKQCESWGRKLKAMDGGGLEKVACSPVTGSRPIVCKVVQHSSTSTSTTVTWSVPRRKMVCRVRTPPPNRERHVCQMKPTFPGYS